MFPVVVAFAGVQPLRDVSEVDRRVDRHRDGLAALVSFGREQALGAVGKVGALALAAGQVIALLNTAISTVAPKAFAQIVVVLEAGGEAGVYDVDLAVEKSARRIIRITRIGLFPTFYDVEWDAF